MFSRLCVYVSVFIITVLLCLLLLCMLVLICMVLNICNFKQRTEQVPVELDISAIEEYIIIIIIIHLHKHIYTHNYTTINVSEV